MRKSNDQRRDENLLSEKERKRGKETKREKTTEVLVAAKLNEWSRINR
jgi:hypothetical protein